MKIIPPYKPVPVEKGEPSPESSPTPATKKMKGKPKEVPEPEDVKDEKDSKENSNDSGSSKFTTANFVQTTVTSSESVFGSTNEKSEKTTAPTRGRRSTLTGSGLRPNSTSSSAESLPELDVDVPVKEEIPKDDVGTSSGSNTLPPVLTAESPVTHTTTITSLSTTTTTVNTSKSSLTSNVNMYEDFFGSSLKSGPVDPVAGNKRPR